MGNTHAFNSKIHPPPCSRIIERVRRTSRRRRNDARGAFPTFEDGSFPSLQWRSTTRTTTEEEGDIHPTGGCGRWKGGVQRIKDIGRRRLRRKCLGALLEFQEEEVMCFSNIGEDEDIDGLQEYFSKLRDNRYLDEQILRRVDTLSESEEDETMLLYRKLGKQERRPQTSAGRVADRYRQQHNVKFLV